MNWATEWKKNDTLITQAKDDVRLITGIDKPSLADDYRIVVNGMHSDPILIFECLECGQELDINTKSFTQLYEHAKEKNWLIKWNDIGYLVHCPKCR